MNLEELDNFQLAKAINFNTGLNPQIYMNDKMRPLVRNKLIEIADHFREFLGVQNIALVDITLSGSNAAYSYTPHSDVDLHLIVDFTQLPDSDVYRELFNSKKYQYNDMHAIKIKGYDVELYVQDAAQPHKSLGEYSVMKNDWNRIPTKQRANLNDNATILKYEKLKELAIRALASNNEKYVNDVLDMVKRYRQAGLEAVGEFGPENLAFKMLRTDGYFEKLWAKKRSHTDRDLSLEQVQEAPDTELEEQLSKEWLVLQQVNESTAGQYVYHVTFTGNVSKISKEGLKPLQTSNWKQAGTGERYNENGGVFAFEHPEDAFKWAFNQNFEFKKPVSIIQLKNNSAWGEDPSQDIALQFGKGKALKSMSAIPASDVLKSFEFADFKTPIDLGISQGEWIDGIIKALSESQAVNEQGRIVQGVNTTQDVGLNQTKIEAKKLVGDVTVGGVPEIPKNGVPKSLYESVLTELNMSPGRLQKQVSRIVTTAKPVIGLEFEVCLEADRDANPEISEHTYLQDLQDYFDNSEDDEVWNAISEQHMEWASEKESEWAENQVDGSCNTPSDEYDRKIEIMQNTSDPDADEIVAEITGDEDDIELTDEIARESLTKAHEAFKKHGDADEWPMQESTNPYIKLYYQIFIEYPDDARQALSEFYSNDFWESEFPNSNDYTIGAWLLKDQIQSMREVGREFDGLWSEYGQGPEGYQSGGFSYDDAHRIAGAMGSELGHEVQVVEEGEDLDYSMWNITMDSSIKPRGEDDVGMEIIMPPTEYEEAIADVDSMIQFLRQNNGYTNESTGLHINVSMAGIDHEKLDYAKLVLLVGDKHVQAQFDRSYNEFALNSLQELSGFIDARQGANHDAKEKAIAHAATMVAMRKDVNHALMNAFSDVGVVINLGKNTSVGIKDNRIEFRSAGGDYLHSFNDILNAINRFIIAYATAADPTAYRKEYAKKLYKFTTTLPGITATKDRSAMAIFAAFNSGVMTKEELVSNLKLLATRRQAERQEAEDADDVDRGAPGGIAIDSIPQDDITESAGLYPFYTDTTEMPDYDDLIKALQTNDEYFLKYMDREKGLKPELVTMSPDQYIDTVVKYNKTTRHNVERERDPEKVERFARKMQAGEKFPILMIDYTRSSTRLSQEGIHRSMAAIKAGVDTVPVLIIRSTD